MKTIFSYKKSKYVRAEGVLTMFNDDKDNHQLTTIEAEVVVKKRDEGGTRLFTVGKPVLGGDYCFKRGEVVCLVYDRGEGINGNLIAHFDFITLRDGCIETRCYNPRRRTSLDTLLESSEFEFYTMFENAVPYFTETKAA